MNTKHRIMAAAVCAATTSLPVVAESMLEEVIVTAQKRETGLQDTSIAITALSGDALDDLNITSAGDYEALVPSLSVREEPSRLFLRGIGRVTNTLGTEPGIGLYRDGIYSSELNELNRSTSLTTERIEVLRGPQGTLFGRNTSGGAINIISKRPTENFEHQVRGTIGNYDRLDWGVSSSGPITDALGYRVYAKQQTRDGYIENISGKDIWDQDNRSWGAQLSWDVSDTFNIWFSYASDETDDYRNGLLANGTLITPYITDQVTQDGFFLSEQFGWDKENPTLKDPYKVDYNDALRTRDYRSNKYATHLTWDLSSVTLKYIGSYSENDWEAENGDFGFTSNPDVRGLEYSGQFQDSQSHEIQLLSASDGALQWVVGFYYYESDKDQPYIASTPTADPLEYAILVADATNPAAELFFNPGRRQVDQFTSLETESKAVYADGNYSFNPEWKLTLGVRYTEDEKDGYEAQTIIADPRVAFVAPGVSAYDALKPLWNAYGFPENCCGFLDREQETFNRRLKDDWSNVSGRMVLDYTPNDDILLYASIANGYKAGGFNLGPVQPDGSFDEETVLSYELGFKGTFADVLRVNAAAFFYTYDDMQVQTNTIINGLLVEQLVNAGESEVKGLEIEATWLATENLTLMANYSYLDGEYTEFDGQIDTISGDGPGDEQDLSGNPLTQAPKNKVYLNAAYAIPTQSIGEFVLSGAYSWVDERQYDAFNTDATLGDSYYRVDAMATWFSPSQDLRVILAGRNLTEEETYMSLERLNSAGAVVGFPNAPRTYSLEVQYSF
ncbi:TonB-dependent receptor [Pseudohalioglobus sediminis]|uniref:TonB-dependent receptor n=1 Tax=Pseudohalioglobus sediminis TaxID=2606449 RepID=A0A5B0X4K5_9GAMM|nr:TonB-dependent receptor [Pseudohalioglobus sediminis]KAA1194320.1 TonB-dependent receptor [Pseudohalioglobus sediminis]